jgi:cell division septal protein FtsQ
MMKLFDRVQKTLRRLGKRKSANHGYRRSDFTLRSPSEQRTRKRITILSHWLKKIRRRKKPQAHEGYSRRQPKSKLLARLVAAIVLVTVFSSLYYVIGSNFLVTKLQQVTLFKVSEIVFSGNTMVSSEKLREISGIVMHQTSLIGLDEAAITERLSRIPWVASVDVQRNFPSTIAIRVTENVPLALVHDGFGDGPELSYIDRHGQRFSPVRPGSDLDFPVITGLYTVENPEVRQQALEEVLTFLKKIERNDPHLPAQSVSEIHLNQHGEMVVYLVEYPFPIFFGNGNTKSKYARLVEVLKALYRKHNGKELISDIEYIQMDYMQDKVLVAQSSSS